MAMKRPASMKRPAASDSKRGKNGEGSEKEVEEEEVKVELTAAAVKDHNKFCDEAQGMSVQQFEMALNKLDSKASMRLWKAFENSRRAYGEDEAYQAATKDKVGNVKKKRQLLFGWINDGTKFQESYRSLMDSVTLKKAEGVSTSWLTKAQAIAHWGTDELRDRVKRGTVIARRDPNDNTYWQFRAKVEYGKVEVERAKSTTAAGKAKAEKHDVLDMLAAHSLEQLTEGEFVPGVDVDDEEEDEELPAGLAAALGDKEDKKKKNVPKKEDKWEALSQMQEGEGTKKLESRLMAFKTELTKDIANLEAALHSGKSQVPKPLVKDVEKAVAEGQGALTSIQKCMKGGSKKTAAAPVLQAALVAVKALKSKKLKALKAE